MHIPPLQKQWVLVVGADPTGAAITRLLLANDAHVIIADRNETLSSALIRGRSTATVGAYPNDPRDEHALDAFDRDAGFMFGAMRNGFRHYALSLPGENNDDGFWESRFSVFLKRRAPDHHRPQIVIVLRDGIVNRTFITRLRAVLHHVCLENNVEANLHGIFVRKGVLSGTHPPTASRIARLTVAAFHLFPDAAQTLSIIDPE